MTETSCGFVALIGAPNAGKSTLINALGGSKVSVVSRKAQTTRSTVRGIVIEGTAQIIFVDTPGLFAPKRRLDRAMAASAWGAAGDADVLALLIDARQAVHGATKGARDGTQDESAAPHPPGALDEQTAAILRAMGPGPWLYPEDQITDAPLRVLAAEITREKLFERLHDELPYQTTVETDQWKVLADGSARIEQTIFVTRESHKKIVIGEGGRTLKAIGSAARKEIAEANDGPVHLFLFVKVRANWLDDPERYRAMGLEFPKN